MKILIFQPEYPISGKAADCLKWQIAQLDNLQPGSADLIVLPEYSNCPGIGGHTELIGFIDSEGAWFVEALKKSAVRIKTLIAGGVVSKDANGELRNQCILISPEGKVVFSYEKLHLTAAEQEQMQLKSGDEIKVFEYQGIRYGFAICFDIYFPEYFVTLAEAQVDIIIAPSYQRSETASRIEVLCSSRAIDSGATILRSSYAMPDQAKGGRSSVTLPDGRIIENAGSAPLVIEAEINPFFRFMKPESHGRPEIEHRQLISKFSRPGVYSAGNLIAENNALTAEAPLICAHRGLSGVIPENTAPSFAAAIASGAHEIEFDLWFSRDGVPVVCHDPDLKRVAGEDMYVMDSDWKDIHTADTGKFHDPAWQGVRIARLEEIVERFGNKTVMNIHIKDPGPDDRLVKMVCDLIRRNGMLGSAYIAGETAVLEPAFNYAREVKRCCLENQHNPEVQLSAAIKYECFRAQLFTQATEAQINAFKNAGIQCNLFFADTCEEAEAWHKKGIDVILTNYAHTLCDYFGHGFQI